MKLRYLPGQTPLDPDEASGLIPDHITTQNDLNEWEAANIVKAREWLYSARLDDVLDEGFCLELHRCMFCDTWNWAGKFRRSDKNIGSDWRSIAVALRNLYEDVDYWIAHGTYGMDETAARFHHRLVAIHPFANGNGRHARMSADALLLIRGAEAFSWGQDAELGVDGNIRANYIRALKAADESDIGPLLAFARS